MMFSKVAGFYLKRLLPTPLSTNNVRTHFTYYPTVSGPGKIMNMFTAINNAMDLALQNDESALLFGEDVGFGGVFRY